MLAKVKSSYENTSGVKRYPQCVYVEGGCRITLSRHNLTAYRTLNFLRQFFGPGSPAANGKIREPAAWFAQIERAEHLVNQYMLANTDRQVSIRPNPFASIATQVRTPGKGLLCLVRVHEALLHCFAVEKGWGKSRRHM